MQSAFVLTRILGELRKLGIKKISRQTVRNILKEEGIQPRPNRTSDTWANFLEWHKETLWACDFFSVKTVTKRGLKDMYVLVWLCMTSREVIVSTSTEHPTSTWVSEQARKFIDETAGREHKPEIVMHDRDTKFSREFSDTLKAHGLKTNKLPKRSPNLNGRCEKIIGTIKNECLAKFIVFGRRHLDHLVAEFTEYYNQHRSHMCRGHLPPLGEEPEEVETLRLDEIEVKSFVGGLVKGFQRKAG